MLNRRLLLASLALALPLVVWTGCSSHRDPWEGREGPPKVVVTFPPLASWVAAVSDGKAGVICLCTDTGPHNYDYSAKAQIGLRNADLFLANGLGLDEHFANKLMENLGKKKTEKPELVELGEDLPKGLLRAMKHDHDEGHQHHGHKHEGEYDPHVWLGIPTAKKMVEGIRDQLTKVNPESKAVYDKQTADYLKKLDELHDEGKKVLAAKKDYVLVTFHESLGYFAPSFGLTVADFMEGSPGDVPSGKKMADLVELFKKSGKKTKVIAIEPQFVKNSADILRDALKKDKIDVELVVIDPLETEPDPKKLTADWYIEKMKANIAALDKALQ